MEEAAVIEGTGERDALGNGVRVTEGEVGGMVAAEGATVDGEVDPSGAMANEREDFVEAVLFVVVMTADAVCGVNGFVVPGLGIDAIDAEEHELAGVKPVVKRANHELVFVLMEAAH